MWRQSSAFVSNILGCGGEFYLQINASFRPRLFIIYRQGYDRRIYTLFMQQF